jgi:hypothetical protein
MFQATAATASTLNLPAAADRAAGANTSRLFVASAVLLALAAAALLIDLPLARFIDSLEVPYDVRHLVRLGEGFGWGGSVALIVLAAAVLDPRGWRVVPRLAVVAFGSGLLPARRARTWRPRPIHLSRLAARAAGCRAGANRQ